MVAAGATSGVHWFNVYQAVRSASRVGAVGIQGGNDHLSRWSGQIAKGEEASWPLDLLENWLLQFECGGANPQPYHLVGHTEGWSFGALVEAERLRKPLINLRSWSTVGTPFLGFQGRRSDLWLMLPLLATAWVTPPTVASVGGFFSSRSPI